MSTFELPTWLNVLSWNCHTGTLHMAYEQALKAEYKFFLFNDIVHVITKDGYERTCFLKEQLNINTVHFLLANDKNCADAATQIVMATFEMIAAEEELSQNS